MLVRSPTLTNRLVLGDRDRLEPGQPQRRRDRRAARAARRPRRRRRSPRCARASCRSSRRRCSPARWRRTRRGSRPCGPASRRTRRRRWAGRRWGGAETKQSATRRQLGDVGTHLLGPERAVEADGERADVAHGVPERLGDLPGQGAAAGVGDGARDDHRPAPAALLEERLEREDRGLGVQGVEDRLDQQEVGAAVDQPAGLPRGRPPTSSSKVTLRAPGSLTSGEMDAVLGVGPSEPATKRGRSGGRVTSSAASRASAAAATFIS